MGIDLSDIVEPRPAALKDFKGRAVAIDGYNALYQFLSSIRQADGTPLMDSKGRITSHLSGTFQRTANLLEQGIRPVYVFDGAPNPMKAQTLRERRQRKEKAQAEWDEALEAGDMEVARMKAQQTSRLTKDMAQQAKDLLEYMGVPCVDAPQDGEAQASYMAAKGDVFAAASQDYDSLLFGAPVLVRNMTLSGRRKMPRRNVYVDVVPETLKLSEVLGALGITREQLVDIGVLMGTDFNDGVRGIGPKKGLKLIAEFGSGE
ncbi:MAG: flap endonuclease-1, partial [Thermoplasmata archaeon]|nr:flap endonuclease-1 [Thermoplasmata archaeon]